MKKTRGSFYYPPLINEQALYIGGLRDTVNLYTSERHPKFARPNLKVSQLGCKCEMIAQYFFWSHKYKYDATQMLGVDPIKDCDIKVNGMRIDVKGLPSNLDKVRVNERAHNKDKNTSHYLFVRPDDDTLDCQMAEWWLYSHEEVTKWDLVDLKFSKAYQKEII
jgi:hypothetical protein